MSLSCARWVLDGFRSLCETGGGDNAGCGRDGLRRQSVSVPKAFAALAVYSGFCHNVMQQKKY